MLHEAIDIEVGAPSGKTLWRFKFWQDPGRDPVSVKPVLGVIEKRRNVNRFIKLNEFGMAYGPAYRIMGFIYADTYEEAVAEYNRRVDACVMALKDNEARIKAEINKVKDFYIS